MTKPSIIQILSILAIILLIVIEIKNIFYPSKEINIIYYYVLIENFIAIILFTVLTFFPHKLELLAIIAFNYSIEILLIDEINYMGLFMFYLGISILYYRSFFTNNKLKKIILLSFIYCFLLISKIHFSFDIFIEFSLNSFAYLLILSFSIFIIKSKDKNKIYIKETLNLSDYPETTEKDVILLNYAKSNMSYKVIARELYRTEGTVRNRLNKLYDILGVFDRLGFLSTFYNHEIVYSEKVEDK